jgi:hypothetical protein
MGATTIDQNERDHATLREAVASGRVGAEPDGDVCGVTGAGHM